MMHAKWLFAIALLGALTAPAAAQQAQQPKDSSKAAQDARIPAEARPPKGMCRIWIDGVPAAQQPAPTDCKTAVKNLPSNGRVVFGDDYSPSTAPDEKKTKVPPIKGFTDVRPPIILPKRPPAG